MKRNSYIHPFIVSLYSITFCAFMAQMFAAARTRAEWNCGEWEFHRLSGNKNKIKRPSANKRARAGLTDDIQAELVWFHGYGGDLTFVDSPISLLRPLYAESPFGPFTIVVRALLVHCLEPLIARVRVRSRCQDMDVPVSHPGYLCKINDE